MEITGKKIGFIITDSFCNFQKLLSQMKTLKKLGADLLPLIDNFALDISKNLEKEIETICENKILHTIEDIKSISHKNLTDIIIIAPASENTISKLAYDIIDTPATLAVKSHLRNNLPVVIAVSTPDGLRSQLDKYCNSY